MVASLDFVFPRLEREPLTDCSGTRAAHEKPWCSCGPPSASSPLPYLDEAAGIDHRALIQVRGLRPTQSLKPLAGAASRQVMKSRAAVPPGTAQEIR